MEESDRSDFLKQYFVNDIKTEGNAYDNYAREGIQKTLQKSGFTASGASRPISFQSSGDRDVPVQLVQITKGKRSGFGYDFQPIELISSEPEPQP